MGRLTESVQGLREAIHRQEKQLKKFVKNGELHDMPLSTNRTSNDAHEELYQLSDEQLHANLENQLRSTGSEISHASHWSCSLDTIHSSVGDLKTVLKKQDNQAILLMTENEELKNELKKKEKEIKKQKFLLKAERETFEQYKKDTLNEVKKNRNDENEEQTKPDKTTQEITKLQSELSHYRQLYLEQHHTVNRLTKLASSLKQDRIQLKDKLFLQEKRYNKFILEMAQRFDVSRKEFKATASNKFALVPIPPSNLAVCKIIDRNARLAHDNCMLRLEVTRLKELVFERKVDGNKMKSRTSDYFDTTIDNGLHFMMNDKNVKLSNILKSNSDEKTVGTSKSLKCEVKTSVSSLIERNFKNCSNWQDGIDKSKTKFSESTSKCSEITEIMRTESAPQLCVMSSSDLT